MLKYKILLLEDDILFSETLEDFLEEYGYCVTVVHDPISAYEVTYKDKFDLYLFDINLPFESGFEALKNLKDANDNTPTIFLTSRDDKESLLKGFSIGAKDYIKKPFDLDEFLARVRAHLPIKKDHILIGKYLLDLEKNRLLIDDKEVTLTIKSAKLLELLYKNINSVVCYNDIYNYLWEGNGANNSSLRVYIAMLKRYFNIESIRGVGYCLESTNLDINKES